MRRAAALHLQGAGKGSSGASDAEGIGKDEWKLLGHLLLQFVQCHGHLLDGHAWAQLRMRILHLCAVVAGEEEGKGKEGGGLDELSDAEDVLGSCRDRRTHEVCCACE
jgi:hypothetical protein